MTGRREVPPAPNYTQCDASHRRTPEDFMKRLSCISTILLLVAATAAARAELPALDIDQTVVKVPVEADVSADDAIESMKLRANILNIKLVAELPLSQQIKAMGEKSRRIEIYQFCDALTAKNMVEYNMSFAAYLPCRITLVEDEKGKLWLLTMNLDMFIKHPKFDARLKQEAVRVRDTLMEIMNAGAKGEL
jgi:uncharacterized protein (DUF302 family)